MRRRTDATVELLLNGGVTVAFAPDLEVALDCAHCLKRDRTVHFRIDSARCGETDEAVDGALLGRWDEDCITAAQRPAMMRRGADEWADPENLLEGESCAATRYRIEYEFTDFVDGGTRIPASPVITWGRVRFGLVCGACGAVTQSSTQNNLKRPRRIDCVCGRLLAIDARAQPSFSAPTPVA